MFNPGIEEAFLQVLAEYLAPVVIALCAAVILVEFESEISCYLFFCEELVAGNNNLFDIIDRTLMNYKGNAGTGIIRFELNL